jgi:hypothetical protein
VPIVFWTDASVLPREQEDGWDIALQALFFATLFEALNRLP